MQSSSLTGSVQYWFKALASKIYLHSFRDENEEGHAAPKLQTYLMVERIIMNKASIMNRII